MLASPAPFFVLRVPLGQNEGKESAVEVSGMPFCSSLYPDLLKSVHIAALGRREGEG